MQLLVAHVPCTTIRPFAGPRWSMQVSLEDRESGRPNPLEQRLRACRTGSESLHFYKELLGCARVWSPRASQSSTYYATAQALNFLRFEPAQTIASCFVRITGVILAFWAALCFSPPCFRPRSFVRIFGCANSQVGGLVPRFAGTFFLFDGLSALLCFHAFDVAIASVASRSR